MMFTDVAKIRAAQLSEVRLLLPLIAAYYAFDSIAFDEDTIRNALLQVIRDQTLGRVWVIDTGQKLAGYAVLAYSFDLEFGGREAIVTDLFVSAGYRGKGFGTRLLGEIMKFCRRSKLNQIELNVTRGNRKALAFYKTLGFVDRHRTVMTVDVSRT